MESFMALSDDAPLSSPSLDQQRDALQKGLGRAVQWAMARRLDDEPLLAACLQDLRYDTQVDEPRGEWLWRMVQEVGAVDRFREPILQAFQELSDEQSASQLCELARSYAAMGDDAFRTRLYEIVDRKPIADRPWLGEEEIIRLDGEDAFLFAARARGESLAGRDWDWDEDSLVDQAIERFGEERVNDLLDRSEPAAIRTFREGWQRRKQENAERRPGLSHRETMRRITVREIIAAAESSHSGFGSFRGWGMFADVADLEMVLRHLLDVREPTVLVNLLAVFSNREFPPFDPRLIELCRHSDAEVRHRALVALEKVGHPLVREFALSELESGFRGRSSVGLLSKNFQRGDERRILEAIQFPDDECELHWLLMDVIKVLEGNPDADCSRLGIITYASTPCERCRSRSVRLLHRHQVAPGWLTEECCFDSSGETRELVREIAKPPEPEPG